jgi:hypothetical protein
VTCTVSIMRARLCASRHMCMLQRCRVSLTPFPQPFPGPEVLFTLRPLCERLVLSLSNDISRFESYVF